MLSTLLKTCADAVVRTSDGTDIPCCKYTCMAACSVLRDLAEATELCTTEDAKTVILPVGISAEWASLAMDLVHGLRVPEEVSLESAAIAREALDYLGCTTYHHRLLDRIVHLLDTDGQTEILKYAPRLLESPRHRVKTVCIAIRRMPLWNDFRHLVTEVTMDGEMARFLAACLIKFFSPPPVLDAIVRQLPDSTDASTILSLLNPADGVYYHPRESLDVVGMLLARIEMSAPAIGLCQAVLNAHKRYDTVPMALTKVHGSMFVYDNSPMMSVLLHFDEEIIPLSAGGSGIRPTSWMCVRVRRTGSVHVSLDSYRIDELSKLASGVQLRVTAFAERTNEVVEVWWSWTDLAQNPSRPRLSTHIAPRAGSLAVLESVVRGSRPRSRLRALRLDVFYGPTSVLDRPLRC